VADYLKNKINLSLSFMCGVKTEKNFPKKKNKHLLTYILLECNKIKSFTKKKFSSAAFFTKKATTTTMA